MYNWYGLNQIEDDSWLYTILDRQRSTKEVVLIAYLADASYAINNTSFVNLCLSSIVASYHLLSSIFIELVQ